MSIAVGENNPNYSSANGLLLSKDGKTLIQGINGGVTIPDSVTSVGERAFRGYAGLTSVTMPDSVTSVGSYAFNNCYSLTSVAMPDGMTSIGERAFSGCVRLSSMTIPDGVTNIGDYAFMDCGLTSVTFDGNAPTAGTGAFANVASRCKAIVDMVKSGWPAEGKQWNNLIIEYKPVPDGKVLYKTTAGGEWLQDDADIADGAFNGFANKENAVEAVIPSKDSSENSVTDIGDSAFYNCTGLTSVTFDGNAPTAGTGAFANVASGCKAIVDPTKEDWPAEGELWNGLTIEYKPVPDGIVKYKASDGAWHEDTADIRNGTFNGFANKSNAVEAIIPSKDASGNDVTSIGEWAFIRCSGLTNVRIPDSVTSIGEWAFGYCSGLTSVVIPNSVTSIGDCAFSGCSGLMSVTIPDGVTSIGEQAFANCSGLTSVTIPDSVTSIGNGAFMHCGLTSVTIGGGAESIGNSAFAYCASLASVTIPDSVTNIGLYAFGDCSGLTSVTISNGVESIQNSTFMNCTSLTSVIIPDSVTSIGNDTFHGCSKLASVTIPDSVTNIGDYAFMDCGGLASVTIVANGGDAEAVKTKMISAGVKSSIEWIMPTPVAPNGKVLYRTAAGGEWLEDTAVINHDTFNKGVFNGFANKNNAVEVIIPSKDSSGNDVTSISDQAFRNCSNLVSVTVPDGITSILDAAFSNCTSLERMMMPGSMASIGSSAFENCIGLTSMMIPDGVASI